MINRIGKNRKNGSPYPNDEKAILIIGDQSPLVEEFVHLALQDYDKVLIVNGNSIDSKKNLIQLTSDLNEFGFVSDVLEEVLLALSFSPGKTRLSLVISMISIKIPASDPWDHEPGTLGHSFLDRN